MCFFFLLLCYANISNSNNNSGIFTPLLLPAIPLKLLRRTHNFMTDIFFPFNQKMAAVQDIRCTIVTFKASSQTWNLWYLFAYRFWLNWDCWCCLLSLFLLLLLLLLSLYVCLVYAHQGLFTTNQNLYAFTLLVATLLFKHLFKWCQSSLKLIADIPSNTTKIKLAAGDKQTCYSIGAFLGPSHTVTILRSWREHHALRGEHGGASDRWQRDDLGQNGGRKFARSTRQPPYGVRDSRGPCTRL